MKNYHFNPINNDYMTDLEYIVKQAKKFYYIQWDEAELRKCVDMLPTLEHDELVRLFNCKWTKKVLKEAIFNILYMDRIGEREERFREMSTIELINDFEERSKGNVSLIRQELRKRYKENMGDDRMLIAAAFNRGTKDDKTWITLQIRKEFYDS